MAHRWTNDLTEVDATPEAAWLNRRRIIASGGAALGALAAGRAGAQASLRQDALEPNTFEEITSYNNFYEFGVGKSDPAENAGAMETSPWTVEVDGMVANPGRYAMEDLVGGLEAEDRIYRFRCVEAWSMVIPWNGVELADVLDRIGVSPDATHIRFETAVIPDVMPGVRQRVMNFPYVEGLRMDEARHPLTLLATGIYGKPLLGQNGAPVRLVVPWKYGFKSIKSLVRITATDAQPLNSWQELAPNEYGFYANVNPDVDHRRWSQATEKRIGGGLFARREPTLMFNGYEEEVAPLYEGMDLAANY